MVPPARAPILGGLTPNAPAPREQARPTSGVAGRILIVDDSAPFVQVLYDALAPRYEVLTAQTGAAALESIAQHPPDLVLLDYVLPDIPGLAILRTIKKLFPAVIVILITGFGSEHVSVEAFRGGARDYLKKPLGLPDLLARIEKLLGTRGASPAPRTPVLLEAPPADQEPPPGSRAASMRRAVAFIEAHSHEPLMLEQVAREAGMSKFHFCRAFKEFTGYSFRGYMARLRVVRAEELLRDPTRSVTDVCFEVGFNDITHFGRVFRRLTGRLPSASRRHQADPSRPPSDSAPA